MILSFKTAKRLPKAISSNSLSMFCFVTANFLEVCCNFLLNLLCILVILNALVEFNTFGLLKKTFIAGGMESMSITEVFGGNT